MTNCKLMSAMDRFYRQLSAAPEGSLSWLQLLCAEDGDALHAPAGRAEDSPVLPAVTHDV